MNERQIGRFLIIIMVSALLVWFYAVCGSLLEQANVISTPSGWAAYGACWGIGMQLILSRILRHRSAT